MHMCLSDISIVKDTRGYFVGQSSTTVCKTDLLIVNVQWFRKGNRMTISNSAGMKSHVATYIIIHQ